MLRPWPVARSPGRSSWPVTVSAIITAVPARTVLLDKVFWWRSLRRCITHGQLTHLRPVFFPLASILCHAIGRFTHGFKILLIHLRVHGWRNLYRQRINRLFTLWWRIGEAHRTRFVNGAINCLRTLRQNCGANAQRRQQCDKPFHNHVHAFPFSASIDYPGSGTFAARCAAQLYSAFSGRYLLCFRTLAGTAAKTLAPAAIRHCVH